MAQRSLDLIEAMHAVTRAAQPITGRGVGYKLFIKGLTASMARSEMARVYRLLLTAREQDIIPWDWIVDETREFERVSTWDDPEQYARCVATSYRRDFWNQQPLRVEVWSEKGTVRGVLQPVLDTYAVGFRVMHGFSSGTVVHDIAEDDDGRPLIALYVGDFDPSAPQDCRRGEGRRSQGIHPQKLLEQRHGGSCMSSPDDPWAPGVRASDVPIEPGGDPSPFADLDEFAGRHDRCPKTNRIRTATSTPAR